MWLLKHCCACLHTLVGNTHGSSPLALVIDNRIVILKVGFCCRSANWLFAFLHCLAHIITFLGQLVNSFLCLLRSFLLLHDFISGRHCIRNCLVKVSYIEGSDIFVRCHINRISCRLHLGQFSCTIVERFEVRTDGITKVFNHLLGIVGKLSRSCLDMECSHFSSDGKYLGVYAHIHLTTQLHTHSLLQLFISVTAHKRIVCAICFASLLSIASVSIASLSISSFLSHRSLLFCSRAFNLLVFLNEHQPWNALLAS